MLSRLKKIIPASYKKFYWEKLDFLKITFSHYFIPEVQIDSFMAGIKPLPKVAFVKQDVGLDLYCCSPGTPKVDLIYSTFHRSGPVALFTKFNADFFIVNVEEDPECHYYKFKTTDCGGPPAETFEQYRNESIRKLNGEIVNELPQTTFACKAGQVNWGNYDIVFSMDISVPSRITRKFPSVKWCYMFYEPCVRQYYSSFAKPVAGYDFFLNQRFRTIKTNPVPAYHNIDYPYHLHYYGCFHDLLGMSADAAVRDGILIEIHTYTKVSEGELGILENFGPVRFSKEERIKSVIGKVMKSKYFFSLTRNPHRPRLWGNSMIEAIAGGCLAFGNPAEHSNIDLFTPFTVIRSFNEFVEKIEFLEKNPERYVAEVRRQRKLLNYLCFARPIKEIISRRKFN